LSAVCPGRKTSGTWLKHNKIFKDWKNETHFSAKPPEARAQTRFPFPDVHPRRARHHQGSPGKG
jgi:hypothetical protein